MIWQRRQEILQFWFGHGADVWWKADAAFDQEIRERFRAAWDEERERPSASSLGSADEALAAILLFDQFPRNMFRNEARSFATDHIALAIARGAIDRGYDKAFEQPRRQFFYMPFQHSEAIDDQRRSLLLFTALGDDYLLGFARKHHDVIDRFGRFPHRNAMLGRKSTPEEEAFGLLPPW